MNKTTKTKYELIILYVLYVLFFAVLIIGAALVFNPKLFSHVPTPVYEDVNQTIIKDRLMESDL